MKKISNRIISLILLLVITYIGILYVFSKMDMLGVINAKTTYSNTLPRMLEAEKVNNVDFLFIGSSQVYKGFDPRIFTKHGISSFNLGSNAQTPFNSFYLLRQFLPRMNPKYVVLDLYWVPLELDGTEPGIDLISNMRPSREIIEMALVSKNAYLINTLALTSIKYFFHGIKSSTESVDQKVVLSKGYIDGGFVESRTQQNSYSPEQLESIKPYHFYPNNLQLEYLNKIAKLCKNYNVNLIFTIGPVTKEYKQKMVNYVEYKHIMTQIAKENNVLLFEYNERLNCDFSSKSDFLDRNHLSQSGVRKFNSIFLSDLIDNALIKINSSTCIQTAHM